MTGRTPGRMLNAVLEESSPFLTTAPHIGGHKLHAPTQQATCPWRKAILVNSQIIPLSCWNSSGGEGNLPFCCVPSDYSLSSTQGQQLHCERAIENAAGMRRVQSPQVLHVKSFKQSQISRNVLTCTIHLPLNHSHLWQNLKKPVTMRLWSRKQCLAKTLAVVVLLIYTKCGCGIHPSWSKIMIWLEKSEVFKVTTNCALLTKKKSL